MKVGVVDPTMTTAEIVEFGRDYAPFIQAGGVVISVLGAGIWAFFQMRSNRRIAREKSTLDILLKREWDKDYLEHKAKFNRLRDAEGGLSKWICSEHKNSDEVNSIRYIFNDYELIALAIHHDIIDEMIYKKWFKSSMLRDYVAAETGIKATRTLSNAPQNYVQWENLAQKWKNEEQAK